MLPDQVMTAWLHMGLGLLLRSTHLWVAVTNASLDVGIVKLVLMKARFITVSGSVSQIVDTRCFMGHLICMWCLHPSINPASQQ